jgi:thymidylate synthase (FAD)
MKINLILSSFTLETPPEAISEATKEIERIARVSHQSWDRMTKYSHIRFVQSLIERGHDAALEFGPSIVVNFICARSIANEIVRHRLASFMQESTRYLDFSQEVTYVLPRSMKLPENVDSIIYSYSKNKVAEIVLSNGVKQLDRCAADSLDASMFRIWIAGLVNDSVRYRKLMDKGMPRQIARDMLPHCLKTDLFVSANIRQWRHILKLRTSNSAHPELRFLMLGLQEKLRRINAVLF